MKWARSLTDQNRRMGERTRTVLADVVGLAPRSGRRQEVHLEATEREITYRAAGLHPRQARGSPGHLGTKAVLVLADVGAIILLARRSNWRQRSATSTSTMWSWRMDASGKPTGWASSEPRSSTVLRAHIVPRFFDVGIAPSGVVIDEVYGISMCRVRQSALRRPAWRVDRVFDVACAGLGLLVSAPVIGLIAAAVRVNSPGLILFRQRRIGQDGRDFELLKFRSMHVHHNGATSWTATSTDQAMVGRWLQRTSLDELPRLWNVLRGDMSLVGSRPERPHFVDLFRVNIPRYWDRHRLPVDLTGWAQIYGLRGDETSMDERARLDNLYIESWSPWLDIVVLLRTVGTVLRSTIGLSDGRRRTT